MYKFDVPRVERMAPVLAAAADLSKGTVLSYDATNHAYVPANIEESELPHAILLENVAKSANASMAKILVKGIVFTDEFNITNADVIAYLDMVGIHVFKREEIATL